jgi:hypothetical protein
VKIAASAFKRPFRPLLKIHIEKRAENDQRTFIIYMEAQRLGSNNEKLVL